MLELLFNPNMAVRVCVCVLKAVILAFCSIQKNFIRDIHAKFGIRNSPVSGLGKTEKLRRVFLIFRFGPVLNLTRERKQRQKNLTITSLSFF